mmetsp:Transcript_10485/g.18339  ORF Transcript_10485/g.18339 Transcript_10485/m.18339 type:complete len:180 (-) Transcript_10485:605-1144(-)
MSTLNVSNIPLTQCRPSYSNARGSWAPTRKDVWHGHDALTCPFGHNACLTHGLDPILQPDVQSFLEVKRASARVASARWPLSARRIPIPPTNGRVCIRLSRVQKSRYRPNMAASSTWKETQAAEPAESRGHALKLMPRPVLTYNNTRVNGTMTSTVKTDDTAAGGRFSADLKICWMTGS